MLKTCDHAPEPGGPGGGQEPHDPRRPPAAGGGAAGAVLRHQPRPVLRRDRLALRPAGQPVLAGLHLSGFTPRLLAPAEQDLLSGYGLGITNLVARPTAQASELAGAELKAGAERLATLVERHRPRILAIAGVTAYRTAFGHPRAVTGPQPQPLAGRPVWVLPNPSGLNAHWTLDTIATAFSVVRMAADEEHQDLFPERALVLPPGPP